MEPGEPRYVETRESQFFQRPAFVELLHLLGRFETKAAPAAEIYRSLPRLAKPEIDQALWELSMLDYLDFWHWIEDPWGPILGWERYGLNSFTLTDKGAKLAAVAICLVDGPGATTTDRPLFIRTPDSKEDLGPFNLEDDLERIKDPEWTPAWMTPPPDFASLWDE